MICPACGNVVTTKRNRCDRCGEDLQIYKKMYLLSNRYYNEGLEKAKVRDLSGAILVLRKSLEYYKKNTQARNLLGLVYYEMGETVSALNEWVVSKHLQPEENDADEYMEALQSNPTKLDTLNQTIKKYNSALLSAKQGNEDLAIIQLKKVTSLNPHFVKALQLLALLYMKNGENEKAVKCLIKASKIDVSNTTTLKYLHELGDIAGTAKEDNKTGSKETVRTAETAVFPRTTYKEDKPNIWAFINLIIGVAVGVLAVFFLIVPTVRNNYIDQLKNQEVEYSAELNKNSQNYTDLQKQNSDLQEKVDDLQAQIDGFEVVEYDDTIYNDLFDAAKLYINDLSDSSGGVDYVKIANALSKVNFDKLDKQEAKDLYNQIKAATYLEASDKLYDEGHDYYSNRKYDEALDSLSKAYEYNPENVDAIYFLGRSYHQKSDYENAKKYYTILTENFPDSSRAGEATDKLAELP